MVKCPLCGEMNDDNYPVDVDGQPAKGGCHRCWERLVDTAWYKLVKKIDEALHGFREEKKNVE